MNELEIGQLAGELHRGYMAYAGITSLIRHPYTANLIERLERENPGPASVPIEAIRRNDGSAAFFDLSHALRNISADATHRETHDHHYPPGAAYNGDITQEHWRPSKRRAAHPWPL